MVIKQKKHKILAENMLAAKETPVVVKTPQGAVLGLVKNGVACFRGLPFAAPPLGQLRFLPPQPLAPWADILDCTRFKDSAIPSVEIEPLISRSENCLYLNIWAPENAAGGNLPVLVFIHGGGYSDGSPAKFIFDGSRFAKDGVVQVNISYRLNALGFMSFEETAAENGVQGNIGTLDQIAALHWVKQNIASFGGNPNSVTICGESAGAFSVSNLILSPMANGLFCRAIMESGNILGQAILAPQAKGGKKQALLQSRAFASIFGGHSLEHMQGIDPHKIARSSAFGTELTEASHYSFWPVFDGVVLPENPYKALVNGQFNKVDILSGYNTDEGTMFIPRAATEEEYIHLLMRIFADDALEVLEHYPVNTRHSPAKRARRLIELGLSMGGDIFAEEFCKGGHNVWCYNFNYSPNMLDKVGLGAMHALELIYVFDTVPKLVMRDEAVIAFKENVHNAWLNFVKNGNPNTGVNTGISWPKYTLEGKETMVLDIESKATRSPHEKHVNYFKKMLWE